MANLNYPSTELYQLPKKNVLVISCIDLRLTDNLLHFLHHDNLTNRYDHIALAGTSLCTCADSHAEDFCESNLKQYKQFKHWNETLEDHLEIAITLHHIKDVYIIEHEDCGAYKQFLKNGDFSTKAKEWKQHQIFAKELANKINAKSYHDKKKRKNGDENEDVQEKYNLNVHCFMIDLRGNIDLLYTTKKPKLGGKKY